MKRETFEREEAARESITRLCSVRGCGQPHASNGYCRLHRVRWYRNGDPGPAVSLRDPEFRFWQKVDRRSSASGCWQWTAETINGYGRFTFEGKSWVAHRWAYENFVAPVPAGLQLDHLCRNRGCVNPSHLEPVTALENNRRARAAKTHCRHGHEFTPENTRINPKGARECRECHRLASYAWYLRNKASAQ